MDALAAAVTELARHEGMNLIPVSERVGATPSTLDYVVDGVVTLNRLTLDHRTARELELEKLRGVWINQSRYPFAMECSRFQYIEPLKRERIEEPLRVKPLKNTETHISTGSEDMDKILDGGFEKGSFNVIEMGDDNVHLGIPVNRHSYARKLHKAKESLHLPPLLGNRRH